MWWNLSCLPKVGSRLTLPLPSRPWHFCVLVSVARGTKGTYLCSSLSYSFSTAPNANPAIFLFEVDLVLSRISPSLMYVSIAHEVTANQETASPHDLRLWALSTLGDSFSRCDFMVSFPAQGSSFFDLDFS